MGLADEPLLTAAWLFGTAAILTSLTLVGWGDDVGASVVRGAGVGAAGVESVFFSLFTRTSASVCAILGLRTGRFFLNKQLTTFASFQTLLSFWERNIKAPLTSKWFEI